MKKCLFILSLFLVIACNQKQSDKTLALNNLLEKSNYTSDFITVTDTFNFQTIGRLRKVTLFKDQFYCMFETPRRNTSGSFKKMVVLDKQGDFIEDVFIPGGIQKMFYYDFKIENDSLFLKRTQHEEETFVLGQYVANFHRTTTRNFIDFEDEHYNLYFTCNGEWGGTIYFEDKQTKTVYEGSSTCPIVVNKIDDEYFVTNYMGHMIGFASVIKIPDPKKLTPSTLDFNTRYGSRNEQGIEKLLDTTDFYIPTSFVADKKLFHLYSDDNGTHVGSIKNNKVILVHTFDFRFYAHFNQQLEGDRQLLAFHVPDTTDKGILIIDGKTFHFHFIQ